MVRIQWQWLHDELTLKEGLQKTLGASGQLLKRHFSSKELARAIKAQDLISLPINLVNHLKINPSYNGPQGSILRETESYIAIHKPAGIHSHPLCYSDTDTALNYLVAEQKWGCLEINSQSYDRGLLFRLDNETSGVLILAKKIEFFERFRKDFHTNIKRKLYWAIVDGDFDQEGKWAHYFRATGVKGAKQKVSLDPHVDADEGVLKVIKLLHHDGKSLVLVSLQSGLRHQIRAQLSALGFPILGDELYGGHKAQRLFLHAWRYEWDDDGVEDNQADLFGIFFDLNRALQMSHDMLRGF